MKTRCEWCTSFQEYIDYHDAEWGVPVHDDRELFEMLNLEGAQAGVSWSVVLKKRAGYREAFHDFDVEACSQMSDDYLEELRNFSGIIRNKLKIYSVRSNALAFQKVQAEFGSFDAYLWNFVDGSPIVNSYTALSEVPAQTPRSVALSKDLKKRGFKFIGPTICYAYMQAVGMVNDHLTSCFRHSELT